MVVESISCWEEGSAVKLLCAFRIEQVVGALTFNLSADFSPADEKNITAKPGENVTLPCRAAGSTAVIAVEWRRADLGSGYVLWYRDGQINPGNQNLSYQNRVDLLDRQMKDRDVSLVLKNLMTNDTGLYQCLVQNERNKLVWTSEREKVFIRRVHWVQGFCPRKTSITELMANQWMTEVWP
uniref:Ig-like domain-containing protein n=1 Tax=Poecilia reticulata TaxID=8081 RepID=A0A3P9PFK2_POERE